MQVMLSSCTPPYPPGAIGPMNDPNHPLGPMITNFWGVEVEPFYTHGTHAFMMEIDDDIKGLILRCLADQPAHRPTLEELKEYMDAFENHPVWQDDAYREWFRRVYHEPPAVCNCILDTLAICGC